MPRRKIEGSGVYSTLAISNQSSELKPYITLTGHVIVHRACSSYLFRKQVNLTTKTHVFFFLSFFKSLHSFGGKRGRGRKGQRVVDCCFIVRFITRANLRIRINIDCSFRMHLRRIPGVLRYRNS